MLVEAHRYRGAVVLVARSGTFVNILLNIPSGTVPPAVYIVEQLFRLYISEN